MGRIGASALVAAFAVLFGACSLSDSVSQPEPSAGERPIEALANPEGIDGIPVEALAEVGDDLWVGFDAAGLADVLCASADDYSTGDAWVLALGDGEITLPGAIFSESDASLMRFLFLARAIESTDYCPTSDQNDMMGSIVDSIVGVGEAVGDAFETKPTTTAYLSKYAAPSVAAAAAWAENAIAYAEDQNRRWDSRDGAVAFSARYATVRCEALSLEPSDSPPTTVTGTTSALSRLLDPLQYATPAQVEAHLRDQLGIEGWESFGQAWYDSLVNGLCIRR